MEYADILALFGTGMLAGLLAGFIGIGGGAILTPLCLIIYPALGIPGDRLVQIIFGTNMFLVSVLSLSAVIRHHANQNIQWRIVLLMGPAAVLGSFAGGWSASISNPVFLKRAFAAMLLFSSILIILKGSTRPAPGIKSGRSLRVSERWLPLLALITGFLGSMLGIGGGAIMIMPLILLFRLPVERVAGTSSSVIIFIGLAGTLTYMLTGPAELVLPGLHTGYVWWSAALPLALGGIPMAQVGAWINGRMHDRLLQRIFGIALFIIALRIFL